MIRNWNLRLATIRSTRLKTFETVWSMSGNQQDSYQDFTIWSYRKATLRKKISRSLYWQFSTFKGLSPPIIKITPKNRQQYSFLSIQPHQWLGPPLYQCLGPQRLSQKNMVDLLSPPPLSPNKQKSFRPLFCLIFSGFLFPSLVRIGRFFIKHT